MRRLIRKLAVLVALALAAPAWAATGDDAKDVAREKKAEVRKKARAAKPGEKTTGDRVEDAKDTARATGAKARRQGRKATAKTKKQLDRADQKVKDRKADEDAKR